MLLWNELFFLHESLYFLLWSGDKNNNKHQFFSHIPIAAVKFRLKVHWMENEHFLISSTEKTNFIHYLINSFKFILFIYGFISVVMHTKRPKTKRLNLWIFDAIVLLKNILLINCQMILTRHYWETKAIKS